MKRIALILLFVCIAICSFAAVTQTGYVKTRGRLGSNGQVVPGKRLGGATVILRNGSSVVSNGSGNFTLALPSNKFYLKSVKKSGYVVSDPDMLSKEYAHSANPLILVLDEPTTQLDDKLAIERKLRRTIEKQLQQRDEELEALREANKITQEQYREGLQKLFQDQESNKNFISEMVERYSRIDFDQLDEFQRQFAAFIQNGELVRADSLLRTKGSMDEREAELKRLRDANAREREELSSRQENLSKSEKNEAILLADFGADCYNHYELCKLKFDNDSAAYWLERRASADPANGLWQREAGNFFYQTMADYNKSTDYFERALTLAIEQHGEKSDEASVCLVNLGDIAARSGNYERALEFYDSALEIDTLLSGSDSYSVCLIYNNKAYVFDAIGEYNKAIEYNENVISMLEGDNNSDRKLLADSYGNLGGVYYNKGQKAKALELSKKANEILLTLFDENVSPEIAESYSNLGTLYGDMGDKKKGLEYLFKANDIYSKIYKENHPSVATVYNSIGYLLDDDPMTAIEYYNKALSIREKVFGSDSHLCATVYNNIASSYLSLGEYRKAIPYFETALNLYKKDLGENHPRLANFYGNLARSYDSVDMIDEAIAYYLEAARIYKLNFGEDSDDLADCYYFAGDLKLYKHEFSDALKYSGMATDIRAKLFGMNNRETMKSISQEGNIYYHLGRYKESYDKLNSAYEFFTSEDGFDESRAGNINNYRYNALLAGVKENIFGRDVLNEYLGNNIIVIVTAPGETPAKAQGLEGEYYLLQYNTWDIESAENLFDLVESLNGKPKTITVMKDGTMTKHTFEDKIGCGFLIKKITPEEKAKIIEGYNKWNSQNS